MYAKTLRSIKESIGDVATRRSVDVAFRLKALLVKYADRIATRIFDMCQIDGFEYRIPLKEGARPIRSHAYNAGPREQEVIDETVRILLEAGVISPYAGPWGAPVIVVTNNDGSMRLCTDYSRRNKITEDDSYPCPNVQDCLPAFHDKSVFSSFDIAKAFHNIRVAEEDKEKTAFVTKKGAYVWNVMPFGGKNCPATWARASDWIFRDMVDLVKYVDDVCIASKNDEEHLVAIEAMLERITKYNLKLKLSKCEFFKDSIKFVGHQVSHNTISPCKTYINQVIKLKRPGPNEIGSFMGFMGWLSKYTFGLKKALEPISRLKKKNVKYVWGPEQEQAFLLAKQIIDSADALAMPNPQKEYFLWTDASERAYGGVLMQRSDDGVMVPIEFMSKLWNDSEVNWGMTTKEIGAMMRAIKKWDRFLLYGKFTIHVDAKNIEWVWKKLENRDSKNNQMHYRWLYTLKPYSFTIRHIPGVENVVADWCSRYNDFDALSQELSHDDSSSETPLSDSETSVAASESDFTESEHRLFGQKYFVDKSEDAGSETDLKDVAALKTGFLKSKSIAK